MRDEASQFHSLRLSWRLSGANRGIGWVPYNYVAILGICCSCCGAARCAVEEACTQGQRTMMDYLIKDAKASRYRAIWETKPTKQVEKELKSWQAHFAKNEAAYSWHGSNLTAPGELSDGDRVIILKEILRERAND